LIAVGGGVIGEEGGAGGGPCDLEDHPGKGSYTIDGAFSEQFLQRLSTLWRTIQSETQKREKEKEKKKEVNFEAQAPEAGLTINNLNVGTINNLHTTRVPEDASASARIRPQDKTINTLNTATAPESASVSAQVIFFAQIFFLRFHTQTYVHTHHTQTEVHTHTHTNNLTHTSPRTQKQTDSHTNKPRFGPRRIQLTH
jgi:hypothetical protein